MIVTIDDYHSDAAPSNKQVQQDGDDFKFTVANAGHLKTKLQALNSVLARTPFYQHRQLCFKDILQSRPPRTYVDGAEDVYFQVKHLSWPSKIPEVFTNAYDEVINSRPFTNRYDSRYIMPKVPVEASGPASFIFAPTFSALRHVLPEIDALCNTSLGDFFQKAERNLKPFPFMRLPAELRLQVYDHIAYNEPFVRLRPMESYHKDFQYQPRHLAIVRVCRSLHAETTNHFFNKSTILIQACRQPDTHQDTMCFSMGTAEKYSALFTAMNATVRRTFTRLEIQIVRSSQSHHGLVYKDTSALKQICASLPNLQVVVISFQEAEPLPKTPWESCVHLVGISRTLRWIYTQLPDAGLRIAWDLTGFRHASQSAAAMMYGVINERTLCKLIKRDGSLDLEQSATITPGDLQKWSETRDILLEAFEKRQQAQPVVFS